MKAILFFDLFIRQVPSLHFFLLKSSSAGDVYMYNNRYVIISGLTKSESVIPFLHNNLSLPYNNVFLIVFPLMV